ncbi:MAG TPA: hypothetical protein VFX74_03930, partial [Candidatus Limnocylindria bacterium]|nr:hypothetical protein [Candidatus Limnocylindria bacterium]
MSRTTTAGLHAAGASLPVAILAWTGAVLAAAAGILGPLLVPQSADSGDAYFAVVFLALELGLGVMGALIASRRPASPIGWLLLLAALLFGLAIVGGGYAELSVTQFDASLPLTVPLAWVTSWTFAPAIGVLAIFVPLLFPTGRLPTPRWWPILIPAFIGPLAGGASTAFTPGPLDDAGGILNPFGIPGAEQAMQWVNTISVVTAPIAFAAVILSLVLRYRHGTATERDQIKWFAYPASVAAVAMAIGLPNFGTVSDAAWVVALTSMALLPIAMGIAILRHRLFDIDVIINRTLVYGALSVLLAAVYIASVLLLQELLNPLTADNRLAVAASTLAVVGLFQPLRRWIQAVVDRRFYRSRYDAARVVAGFMARLRDEVELDHLTDELHGT